MAVSGAVGIIGDLGVGNVWVRRVVRDYLEPGNRQSTVPVLVGSEGYGG